MLFLNMKGNKHLMCPRMSWLGSVVEASGNIIKTGSMRLVGSWAPYGLGQCTYVQFQLDNTMRH